MISTNKTCSHLDVQNILPETEDYFQEVVAEPLGRKK